MANITMANNTNNAIWIKGIIALMIDFSTTCKPLNLNEYLVFIIFYLFFYLNFCNFTALGGNIN